MGCDIHIYVEQKAFPDGIWERVPESKGPKHWLFEWQSENNKVPNDSWDKNSWDVNRNYLFFGLLAGVRNESITPLAADRGLPEDVSEEVKAEYDTWDMDGHSHSYLTLSELLKAKESLRPVTGFLDLKNYLQFKEDGYPEDWYTSLPFKAEEISVEEMERLDKLIAFSDGKSCYAEVIWEHPIKKINPRFWDVMVERMKKLDSNPENIRMVFWFDN